MFEFRHQNQKLAEPEFGNEIQTYKCIGEGICH